VNENGHTKGIERIVPTTKQNKALGNKYVQKEMLFSGCMCFLPINAKVLSAFRQSPQLSRNNALE
jgi:hypothetical protein